MKTTLELPDALLRRAKSTAARHGQSMTSFVRAALEAKLIAEEISERKKPWMKFSGSFSDPQESIRIMKRIEEATGSVDPKDWK
jgi:plasmid stability protein